MKRTIDKSRITDDPKPILLFSEYCFIDTAFGGPAKRNNVADMRRVVIPSNTPDCYASVYRYDHRYKDLCDQTGSVKGSNKLPCYADGLVFDIDSSNLDTALCNARELVIELENIDPQIGQLAEFFFSGRKGFHILLPAQLFDWEPSIELSQALKLLAPRLSGGVPTDGSIYDCNRLLRLPNTRHSQSGLFKVPLSFDQLATWTAGQIREHAKTPKGDPSVVMTFPGELKPIRALQAMYQEALEAIQSKRYRSGGKAGAAISPMIDKPCIEAILKGVGEGQRNNAGIRIASEFRKRGFSQDRALSDLYQWNERNSPPLQKSEVESIAESAFSSDHVDYGCNDELLKSLCDDKCQLRTGGKEGSKQKPTYAAFVEMGEDSIAEMLYDQERGPETFFAVCQNDSVRSVRKSDTPEGISYVDSIRNKGGIILPRPCTNIISNGTVLLPTKAEEYGTDQQLLGRIDQFVRRSFSVSKAFHRIIPYFVLLSWTFDRFEVVPYLRLIGDYGTGKSRGLIVIGSICYRPIFAMGAATMSPIFRLLDAYAGTLIYDEADFSRSDEAQLAIKMLNTGYQSTFKLLRSVASTSGNFDPVAFDVYGPKVIATRKLFEDRALESRCITEVMDGKMRGDIPITLPSDFWEQATRLRNMLLLWRFRNYSSIDTSTQLPVGTIQPRMAQILQPLWCVVKDQEVRNDILSLARGLDESLQEDRRDSWAGKVVLAIDELSQEEPRHQLPVKLIADKLNRSITVDEHKMAASKIGKIIKQELNLPKGRGSDGAYVVISGADFDETMNYLRKKFGINRQN